MAGAGAALSVSPARAEAPATMPLKTVPSTFKVDEPLTPRDDVTTYNNFYEFGTGKDDPARYSGDFKPRPWTITVDGMVGKTGTFDIDKLIADIPVEERVYRMRCVEAVVDGDPLERLPAEALLDKVEPLGSAKYVAFETVVRPEEMPGQSGRFQPMPWPYVEVSGSTRRCIR